MAGKHFIIAALSLLIAKFTFGEVASINYGLTNGNITLTAGVKGVIEEIVWKWNGINLFEVDNISREEYGPFVGRISLNFTTGDLTISDLTYSDSGMYRAEAHVEGKLQYSQHSVKIIDPVTDPIVTCQKSEGALTLICASDLSPLTAYSWEGPEGPVVSEGSELDLETPDGEDSADSAVYTCVVKNPVSESRAAIALDRCFSVQGSIIINLAIALGVFSVVLGVLIGILVYCKKRDGAIQRSEQMHKEKEDIENEMPAENDPFIVDEEAELGQEENNFTEGNPREQEDTNSVYILSVSGHEGGFSVDQEGVSIEKEGVSIEQGGIGDELVGVCIGPGGLDNEGEAPQEEPGCGTGNEEDSFHTRLESPNTAGAQG